MARPPLCKSATRRGGALYEHGLYHIAGTAVLLGTPAWRALPARLIRKPHGCGARKRQWLRRRELGLGFVHFTTYITLDIIEAWAIHLDGIEGSSILGTLGGVRLEPFGFYHNIGDLEINSTADVEQIPYRWQNVHQGGDVYDSAGHHWVAALQGRVELLPSAELALNTMLISEGIYLSDQLGREVTAEEVRERSWLSSGEVSATLHARVREVAVSAIECNGESRAGSVRETEPERDGGLIITGST